MTVWYLPARVVVPLHLASSLAQRGVAPAAAGRRLLFWSASMSRWMARPRGRPVRSCADGEPCVRLVQLAAPPSAPCRAAEPPGGPRVRVAAASCCSSLSSRLGPADLGVRRRASAAGPPRVGMRSSSLRWQLAQPLQPRMLASICSGSSPRCATLKARSSAPTRPAILQPLHLAAEELCRTLGLLRRAFAAYLREHRARGWPPGGDIGVVRAVGQLEGRRRRPSRRSVRIRSIAASIPFFETISE